MLPAQIYFLVLALVCAFAIARGGREERVVAITSIVASLATLLLLSPFEQRFERIEIGAAIVDLAVLAIFVGLALRSRRFWPLWVAGIQMTTSFAHIIKAVNIELLPAAYLVAAQFWVYPILLILFVATLRTPRKRTRERGHPDLAVG